MLELNFKLLALASKMYSLMKERHGPGAKCWDYLFDAEMRYS